MGFPDINANIDNGKFFDAAEQIEEELTKLSKCNQKELHSVDLAKKFDDLRDLKLKIEGKFRLGKIVMDSQLKDKLKADTDLIKKVAEIQFLGESLDQWELVTKEGESKTISDEKVTEKVLGPEDNFQKVFSFIANLRKVAPSNADVLDFIKNLHEVNADLQNQLKAILKSGNPPPYNLVNILDNLKALKTILPEVEAIKKLLAHAHHQKLDAEIGESHRLAEFIVVHQMPEAEFWKWVAGRAGQKEEEIPSPRAIKKPLRIDSGKEDQRKKELLEHIEKGISTLIEICGQMKEFGGYHALYARAYNLTLERVNVSIAELEELQEGLINNIGILTLTMEPWTNVENNIDSLGTLQKEVISVISGNIPTTPVEED